MKSFSLFLICLAIFFSGIAQDNNASISDDLKKVWGSNNSAPSNDIYPIDAMTTNNDDPGTGTGNGTDNVLDAPVDGGLSFLMAAGILYGARRIRKRASKA